jgi:hypothetical protein
MGFQFNQVGGGTKTRRPVALRMQYNANCANPKCFLTLENGKEEQRSLADIQTYIEEENKRLEKDPSRCFDQREINIRMEYKYCPNMIVIDTPGMLHPPKGKHLTPQQRGLAMAAKEAESLVMSKISCKDYIILCVEDTTDWKHATTRNVVTRVDPELQRTVLVTTKLDTKIPQFSDPDDLDDFFRAGPVKRMFPHIMGGPFFTSVPAGRVGNGKDFSNNDAFVDALRAVEKKDHSISTGKLGNTLQTRESLSNVGVTRLRTFLEARVEDCYRRNVAKIVPLLQQEMEQAELKLAETEKELASLSIDRLKHSAAIYRERFSKELSNVVQGTVKVSPTEFGETLAAEQLRGGSFLDRDQVQSDVWQTLVQQEIGNSQARLFGGAQYHRAIREFNVAVRHMSAAVVTEDEIANAAGVGDVHDGVNFMRAACVIAVEKAQQSFEPMLEALRHRLVHIMRKNYAVVEAILERRGPEWSGGAATGTSAAAMSNYNKPYKELIRRAFDNFVEERVTECLSKCRDDLKGMTRFVTWDTTGSSASGASSGASAVYSALPTPNKMVEIYSVAVEERKTQKQQQQQSNRKSSSSRKSSGGKQSVAERVVEEWNESVDTSKDVERSDLSLSQQQMIIAKAKADASEVEMGDYHNLMQLTEEMLSGRDAGRTNSVVSALVQYVIRSWRDHFARTVSMKFNCFYLMPFLDDFPEYLRQEVDAMHESGDIGELFDIYEARQALQHKKDDLMSEISANRKLQDRFDEINQQLHGPGGSAEMAASSASESKMDAFGSSAINGDSTEEQYSAAGAALSLDDGLDLEDSMDFGEPMGGSGAWATHFEEE